MGKIIPKEPELRHFKTPHQKKQKASTNNQQPQRVSPVMNNYGYFYNPLANINNAVIPAFGFADYIFEPDGTVKLRTSAQEDANKVAVPIVGTDTNGLANVVMNDPAVKEVVPDLKPDDIFFYQGMLFLRVRRGPDTYEDYRIDIIKNIVYVQAPLDCPLENMNDINIVYNFISVPVRTETGKKILTHENYKVTSMDKFLIDETIFRETECAA